MNLLPNIIETTGRSTKLIDIPTKLYADGIITLFGEIDDALAYTIITQLLYLDSLKDDTPVKLYINSPGGSVYAGYAIHDTIKLMRRKVDTVGFGMCASMGAFLLTTTTGNRSITENAKIMIHSVSSGIKGTVHDMEIDLEESIKLNDKLTQQIANASGQSYEVLKEKMKRDAYLNADEALAMGLIDCIK